MLFLLLCDVLLCYCFSFVSVLVFCLCVLYSSFFLYCTVSVCDVRAATLKEIFPCLFLSRKANARLYLAKMGHGPHFPN
jgi:hypothetical protein